jgi:hypothetical protein
LIKCWEEWPLSDGYAVLLASACGELITAARRVSLPAIALLGITVANFCSTTFWCRTGARLHTSPQLIDAAAGISRHDIVLTLREVHNPARLNEFSFNWHVDSLVQLDPHANFIALPARDLRDAFTVFRSDAVLSAARLRAIENTLQRHPIMSSASRNHWSYPQAFLCFAIRNSPAYLLAQGDAAPLPLPNTWLTRLATDPRNELTLYRITLPGDAAAFAPDCAKASRAASTRVVSQEFLQ